MKTRLLPLLLMLVSIKISATTYTFNFAVGRETNWSNVNNWQAGNYPSSIANFDTIVLLPPDLSAGWICHLDQSFGVTAVTILVKKNAALFIDSLRTLSLGRTGDFFQNFGSKLTIEDGAFCRVKGSLLATASTIDSKGDFIVEKNGFCQLNYYELGFEAFAGSGFLSSGLFINKGQIEGRPYASITANEFRNESIIQLGNGNPENDIANLNVQTLYNYGTISGNSTFTISKSLFNKGDINLQLLENKSAGSITGIITNNSNLSLSGNYALTGIGIINSGSLYVYSSQFKLDGTIQNTSTIEIQSPGIELTGSVTNTANITLSSGTPLGTITCKMNLINHGNFTTQNGGGVDFQTGSVINNNIMTMYGPIYISIPFINKSTLTTIGEVHTGNAFINAGTWNAN